MLSKPKHGWTHFQLEGTFTHGLSYLDDIASEWLDQAIHGLQTLQPFCVKGFLEPRRFLCMVSYWNCHIVIEGDERSELEKDDIHVEYSHTSMLDFCKYLYSDISENIEEWAGFVDYDSIPIEEKKKSLENKLKTLKDLIIANEKCFGDDRCFL